MSPALLGPPESDRAKSLRDLTGQELGEPSTAVTRLARIVRDAWRRPLWRLSPGDLAALMVEGLALRWAVPLALEKLRLRPAVMSWGFSGDLLCRVLKLPPSFWRDWPALRDAAEEIARDAESLAGEKIPEMAFQNALKVFRGEPETPEPAPEPVRPAKRKPAKRPSRKARLPASKRRKGGH